MSVTHRTSTMSTQRLSWQLSALVSCSSWIYRPRLSSRFTDQQFPGTSARLEYHHVHHQLDVITVWWGTRVSEAEALLAQLTELFTALRKALRKQALYMQRQIRPSFRLSVWTRWYCVKTRKRRWMRSSPSGSPVFLVFWHQKRLLGPELDSPAKTAELL